MTVKNWSCFGCDDTMVLFIKKKEVYLLEITTEIITDEMI